MMLEEYNEAEQMELFRQDGVKEGRRDLMLDHLSALMKKQGLSIQEAMDILDIPAEEQSYYADLYSQRKNR